jgi:hypothetical protein
MYNQYPVTYAPPPTVFPFNQNCPVSQILNAAKMVVEKNAPSPNSKQRGSISALLPTPQQQFIPPLPQGPPPQAMMQHIDTVLQHHSPSYVSKSSGDSKKKKKKTHFSKF